VGRPASPGEQIPHRVSRFEDWYFLVFEDGQGALAAGPVNPAAPAGLLPIGMILAIVGLPVIAGLLAFRVEQRLTKVERASQALAVGDFSVRVDNQHGPSDELAANFNAMAERVERLIRSRDELVQAVSHELGSPLSRLRLHMELLENQSDMQREERLIAMTRELDALDELVAELLDYVQSDELALDRHAFDPNRALTDLAELARLEAPDDRPVEVDLEFPNGASVFADQRLFQRAIENILRNSVQHARGKVLLELKQDEEHVRVAVHDDGPGIPEELREKVMVPFFRLEADRSRNTGGVGLGLAIVSRIMHRHGGRLAIDSSPLGGAKVETLWPRRG
jgi:signal transduction histidine kinase